MPRWIVQTRVTESRCYEVIADDEKQAVFKLEEATICDSAVEQEQILSVKPA